MLTVGLFFACHSCGGRGDVDVRLAELLADSTSNVYEIVRDTAPDAGCERMRINVPRIPLARLFNDINEDHLRYARAGGIKPVSCVADAWRNTENIVEVRSDSTMFIDELTHSYPYLTRPAAGLLHDIGRRFRDSLRVRGGGEYRLKVTSLLRTDATVGKLRRVNRNATSVSAHRYGTTFDISYSKFICDDSRATRRTFEDLKNLLAEIIYDLRREKRCLVKYEYRQACFHVTATDTI